MNNQHSYEVGVEWTGNLGDGTSTYRGYTRDYDIACEDRAEGVMELNPDGSGRFGRVTLRPRVTITAESDAAAAEPGFSMRVAIKTGVIWYEMATF